MRIGILTVHRAYNYGSVLQCYALQEYLTELGHEVRVIDYRQPWTEAVYKTFSWYYIFFWIRNKYYRGIIDYLRNIRDRHKKLSIQKKIFRSFAKSLRTTAPCTNVLPQDFDVYMIGSDQLWSHQCIGDEDKIFYGFFKHPQGSRIVGYAISSNSITLNRLGKDKLKRIISNFTYLTMRERSNANLIKQLTNIPIALAIDPTLLRDRKDWTKMINNQWQKKRYIAIYQARPVAGDASYLIKKANKLASKYDMEVIDLSHMTYSVEDFISIIKYAQCVYTTSYHATVFSIIMRTPFYVIQLNDGLDVRYIDLLNALNLESAIVEKEFDPILPQIDFTHIELALAKYKESSVNFLSAI